MGFESVKAFPGKQKYGVPSGRIDLDAQLQISVIASKTFELTKYNFVEILIDREKQLIALRPTTEKATGFNKLIKAGQKRGEQRQVSVRKALNMLGKGGCTGRTYELTKNEDGLLVIDLNKPLDQEKK